MSGPPGKRCVVIYAAAGRSFQWTLDLPAEASIGDAIAAARHLAPHEDIPWESAPVGIFGELRDRADIPAEADRIELYRALRQDPRAKRRERLKGARRG